MVLPVMTFAFWLFACLLVLHIIRRLGLFAYDVVEVFFLHLVLVSKLVAVAWRGLTVFTGTVHQSQLAVCLLQYIVLQLLVGNGTATTEIEIIRELRILETSWFVRWVGKLALIPIRSLFCGLWL